MEPRLSVLAGTVIVLATGGVAAADKKTLARELFELGIEEYKAKQYKEAAMSMGKSYALDPQPNALYALAQAERLSDNCKDALVHYKQVLAEAKDDKTRGAVQANIDLCEQIESGEESKVEIPRSTAETEQRDAPVLQIRTIYRTEQKTDKLAIALFATGGTAIGGSVVAYVLARSIRNDADNAQSLAEYNDQFDRSQRMKWIAYGTAGLGVGLVAWATLRVVGGKKSESRTPQSVSLVPTDGGSLVTWGGRW